MDKFEEWELDAESEDESVMESFSEEMLRLLNPDDAEDKTEDENALWDDPEAEPEDKPKPDSREKDVFEVEQDEVEQAQDLYGEVDADDDGVCYDSITQHPIYRMLLAANKSSSQKRLIRELKKNALERIEFAARSVRDYKQIIRFWDNQDASAARTQRNHEELRGDTPMEWNSLLNDTSDIGLTFPKWTNDAVYSQLRNGSFLDYLFDCPYEMHNLTSKEYLRRPVMELKDEHKEILYFLYLRLYSPQSLACMRGQSDRNVRKVRDVALRSIRRKVYASLQKRKDAGCSLTPNERAFLAEYTPEGAKISIENTEKDGDNNA